MEKIHKSYHILKGKKKGLNLSILDKEFMKVARTGQKIK
jgi:hypothetical protein